MLKIKKDKKKKRWFKVEMFSLKVKELRSESRATITKNNRL